MSFESFSHITQETMAGLTDARDKVPPRRIDIRTVVASAYFTGGDVLGTNFFVKRGSQRSPAGAESAPSDWNAASRS
ncbi:MAG: hypothetical protein GY741_01580, partial [Phycisphaeraceae bacterium]|nr:hypothetical protein [Phycisphaeraceae bacterium]